MNKWPKKVKHRKKVLAKIYRPCQGRESYRVAWSVGTKRMMKSFPTYVGQGGAKEYAEGLVKELANGSQVTALTPGQANDALAAMERLQSFYESTGRKVSLRAGIAEYCDAAAKLHGRTLGEAVQGYLSTVASVKRKDLTEAVEEFIAGEETRTKAGEGQRAQLSAKYHYNRAIQLRRFAGAFPGYAVCDLSKELLDTFFSSKQIAAFSTKSRKHHLTAIWQFLSWATRKDYIGTHRLNEADSVVRLKEENGNTAEVTCYTAKEFRALLEAADGPVRAMIAIGGLAGLRTQELLRLSWEDVWRVPRHIEVTAGKAKTRQRRLVEVGAALAQWLQPCRQFKTGPLWADTESIFQKTILDLCGKADMTRKPNGLRHSFCSFALVLHGENWTAQQAGNSPGMIHAHYKGLATKKEAQAWFAVKPAKGSAAGKILIVPQLAGVAA